MAIEKMALSIKETAEAIGLHPNTVYELVQSGRLPAVKLGRKILISKQELGIFLSNSQSSQSTTDELKK